MKILQLNIEKGRFLNEVIRYIAKNDFDVIHFQEVTGGKYSYGNLDCFEQITKSLKNYRGEKGAYLTLTGDDNSYFANASFIRKKYPVLDKTELWFRQMKAIDRIPPTDSIIWADIPHNVICQLVEVNGQKLWLINTHFPWSPKPIDTDNKLELGNTIYNFIKKQNEPFILTGDFNIRTGTKLINKLNTLGRNLTEENKVSNTLNPDTHHVKSLFPPGLAVDYIFTDKSLTLKNFHVVDKPTLSDHFGLATEIML